MNYQFINTIKGNHYRNTGFNLEVFLRENEVVAIARPRNLSTIKTMAYGMCHRLTTIAYAYLNILVRFCSVCYDECTLSQKHPPG